MGGTVRKAAFREVASWCMFDFANSAYTTLIITVAYSVFFRQVVVRAEGNQGDLLWGRATFFTMLLVAVSSPFLGALADGSGRKKLFLILTTLLTVTATGLMYFVGPGDVLFGMLLFVLGTYGFEAGYVFYNAFLPEVSTPGTIGKISGWAWAIGYIGGLTAILACKFLGLIGARGELILEDGTLNQPAIEGYRLSFVLVAVFFLVFALPAFFWLRENPVPASARPAGFFRTGILRLGETLRHLRRYRETAKFIAASLFFNDGITTIISFSAIYATVTFRFSSGDLVLLFLVLNIVAFPGSVIAGYLADRVGPKPTLLLSLALWVGVVVVGALAHSRWMFWIMASGAAIGMGSTQAVGRSFMAQISPPERESEFFGFYVLSGKFASMFGPLLFGFISSTTGNQRLAVFSLLPFFLLGIGLMLWLNADRAILQARDGMKMEKSPS